jgi:hypothetical protein
MTMWALSESQSFRGLVLFNQTAYAFVGMAVSGLVPIGIRTRVRAEAEILFHVMAAPDPAIPATAVAAVIR